MSTAAQSLLVRVRFENQLPPPPFPPRLLHVPTTTQRYSTCDFLTPLANERPLPSLVDAELGLPLELGKIPNGEYGDGEYWTGDRHAVAPRLDPSVHHDDEDSFLLNVEIGSSANGAGSSTAGGASAVAGAVGGVLSGSSTPLAPSTPGGGSSAGMGMMGERKKIDVSWLRKTEYLSSEAGNKVTGGTGGLNTPKPLVTPTVSLDRTGRASAIATTFASCSTPLAVLRHPSKSHLRAVDSWLVLPNEKLWANQFNLVKFGEDPGEAKVGEGKIGEARVNPKKGADPRLPRAIFRPVEIAGEDSRINYYLPEDEDIAQAYEKRRRVGPAEGEDEDGFLFMHVRDYEVATTRKLNKEYIFAFDESEPSPINAPDGDLTMSEANAENGGAPKPPKSARYAQLGDAQTLRKRRPRRNEDPTSFPSDSGLTFWDGMIVQVRGLDVLPGEEQEERKELENEVSVPPKRARTA